MESSQKCVGEKVLLKMKYITRRHCTSKLAILTRLQVCPQKPENCLFIAIEVWPMLSLDIDSIVFSGFICICLLKESCCGFIARYRLAGKEPVY